MPKQSPTLVLIAAMLSAATLSGLTGCMSTTAHPADAALALGAVRSNASDGANACLQPSSEGPPAGTPFAKPDEDLVEVLAQPYWIRSVQPPGGEEPPYRWVYPNFESMLIRETTPSAELHRLLESADRVVAANAAIGLLRTGDWSAHAALAEAVGDSRLDVKLRCAGAESLGRSPAGTALLQHLVDTEVRRAGQPQSGYSPAVHAELVRALAKQVQPADEPRLTAALTADAEEVKLAALAAWQQSSAGSFPEQGVAMSVHRNPEIRANLFAALAQHPSDETCEHLKLGLNDPDLRVRCAAIQAMGVLGNEQAVAPLEQLLHSGVEAERVAAVTALAELGEVGAVSRAAADKAWRVRRAVAEAFANLPGKPDVSLARKLLDDPSAEVQYEVVDAIRTLPPHLAEPLLLDALERGTYRSQVLAIESLCATWPEGRTLLEAFPTGQTPRLREQSLSEIRQAYAERATDLADEPDMAHRVRSTYSDDQLARVENALGTLQSEGADSQQCAEAIASLRQVGPSLTGILEHLVIQRGVVLPDSVFVELLATDFPEFDMVAQLRREDIQVRRRAARRLAEEFVLRSPRPLLASWLAQVAITETDAVVWRHLLAALADQGDEGTFRLVYAAAAHDSAGIRQSACEHLGRHPSPQHAPVLLAALNDASVPVVRAAVEALGFCGGDLDLDPVVELLDSPSDSIQLAAAVALVRQGRPEGPAALELLAYSSNEQTRLRAAQAMGETGLAEFAPALIRLLDDRHGIRVAALRSLPKVADCEAAEKAGLYERERVEAWRRWASQGDGALR